MKKHYDCGIDLGTTNSCIARPNSDNTCDVIDSSEGGNVTPSVVRYDALGHLTVGANAKRSSNPNDVKKEFKREMGTDNVYLFESSGIKKTAVELSAEVLKQLKMDYESEYYEEDLQNVVISVPAAFSLMQCEATKKAGIAAGFKNILLLQEPIAAAIAYGAKPGSREQYWLVFDYGGGTLDVSVISTKDGYLDNINSRGNNHMGGKDLDEILYKEVILPKMQKEYNLPDGLDPISKNRIMESVEKCKKQLSKKDSVTFFPDDASNLYDDSKTHIIFECIVTRQEFEQAICKEIKNTVAIARKALEESGIPESQIDKILLVGGSTNVPLVREELQREFSIKLDRSINPMTVVAEGAALFAATQFVEDEPAQTDTAPGEYTLNYEPKAVTSNDTENILGTIQSLNNRIEHVKIVCVTDENASIPLWDSGWCEVTRIDENTVSFDIDVKICNFNARNLYIISATDDRGSKVMLKGYIFEITHNESVLEVLAPPLTRSVGVLANDGKRNIIRWFIEKNTKLPIEKTCSGLLLDKAIDPEDGESCFFEFYEGEEEHKYNPHACQLVGRVPVDPKSVSRKIGKGAEVEVTIKIDTNRNAKVSASLPDYNIVLFTDRELQALGASVNALRVMTEVEEELKKIRFTLDKLRRKGINVGNLYTRFQELHAEYNKYLELIDKENDSVTKYTNEVYSLETEILQLEVDSAETVQSQETTDMLDRAERNINLYGSTEQKEKLRNLRQKRDSFPDTATQRYVDEQIDSLETDVVSNSFEWLENLYNVVYETHQQQYTDNQKADYWKSEARTAIANQDKNKLKKAIIVLQDLRISSVNDDINSELAHLRVR